MSTANRHLAHIRDLERACDLARDLARRLTSGVMMARDRDLAWPAPFSIDSDLGLYYDLARDLARAMARVSRLNPDLGFYYDLARDLERACDLARRRRFSLVAELRIARRYGIGFSLAHAHARAEELYLGLVRVRSLDGDLSGTGTASRPHGAKRIAPSAAGLLVAAIRLLPTSGRARYAEEYLSELWDLAQSGARGPRQLVYALRQLRCILPVGAALRSPRRKGAAL